MSSIDRRGKLAEEPFSFRATRSGTIFIAYHGKTVTTLNGKAAQAFLIKIAGLDEHAAQLALAKATGHFKHGNERRAEGEG